MVVCVCGCVWANTAGEGRLGRARWMGVVVEAWCGMCVCVWGVTGWGDDDVW